MSGELVKNKMERRKCSNFLQNLSSDECQQEFQDFGLILKEGRIDDAVSYFTNVFHNVASDMIVKPLTSHKLRDQPEWWSVQCEQYKREKNRRLDVFRATNSKDDLAIYKKAKSNFKKICSNAKSAHQEKIKTVLTDNDQSPQDLWRNRINTFDDDFDLACSSQRRVVSPVTQVSDDDNSNNATVKRVNEESVDTIYSIDDSDNVFDIDVESQTEDKNDSKETECPVRNVFDFFYIE
ncbi:hypothetical protein LOTGIDRAFT_173649 [Lottia gigantea]|uniref:Uncharacterized protein n=1 Tax=Lottia gigantea TaxID=225164 RepID=V4CCL2_LOTGI|nr:hypothetical protein LOTGIDRAFT_173649 [Lottia gigantea]ESO99639.1 hypothetical protein LOTGIDRAFT_173649 [Lottia gigantea]